MNFNEFWKEKATTKPRKRAMFDYCHLDTLAMVRVWEKLRELV